MFIVGLSNTKGYLTIGVCLVAPKSNCLTQVWVKQAPRGPLYQFSLFLLPPRNQAKFGCVLEMRSARPVKLLFIVPTPLHHLFVSHAQRKTMFLCLAMCFSAYTSRFSCTKNLEKTIFFFKFFFLKVVVALLPLGKVVPFPLRRQSLSQHCQCTVVAPLPIRVHFVSVVRVDKHFPPQRH